MSITLISRTYKCNNCNTDNLKALSVISDNRVIKVQFTDDHIEDGPEVDAECIYTYEVIRDSYGIISHREAKKIRCSCCGSKDITPYPRQSYSNVMNFYAPGQVEQWFRGLEDLGRS